MKLCLVSPYPPRYLGLGNYARALVPELARHGGVDELLLLIDGKAGQPVDPSLPGSVRVAATWDPDSPRVLLQMLRAIRAERPDVVWFNVGFILGQSAAANMARLCAPALARRMGIPSVTTLHHLLEAQPLNTLGISNSPAHRLAGSLATRLVFAVDRACLPLRRYVNLAQSVYGKFNLTYIPHHVFHPVVEEKQTDRQAEGRGTRLLSFGLLAPYKGIDVLLCAYEAARRSRPELRLRIAGGTHPRFPGFSERWMRDPVPGMAWLGQVPDAEVDRLMAWADVLVVPNLAATGSSSVIHRAAALGKTIVASDIPDFRALADEEQLAIEFAPPADPEALRRTLERVTSDPDLRARARRANLEAARRLTPARVARQYLAVFSGVAAGSEAGALPRRKPSVECSAKEGVGDVLPIVP